MMYSCTTVDSYPTTLTIKIYKEQPYVWIFKNISCSTIHWISIIFRIFNSSIINYFYKSRITWLYITIYIAIPRTCYEEKIWIFNDFFFIIPKFIMLSILLYRFSCSLTIEKILKMSHAFMEKFSFFEIVHFSYSVRLF